MRKMRCRRCQEEFDYNGSRLCPQCIEKKDSQLEIVRDMVFRSPGINAMEVSLRTGIPVEVITKYIDEGYLELKRS